MIHELNTGRGAELAGVWPLRKSLFQKYCVSLAGRGLLDFRLLQNGTHQSRGDIDASLCNKLKLTQFDFL